MRSLTLKINHLFSRIGGINFFLLFAALIIVVGFLQYNILAPHLKYGFADVDWVYLFKYKNLPPFSISQIIGEWRETGVYAYQTYYIGIQQIFYGLDYYKFQLTTNIFKFLSTVTLFPLILFLTRNKLLSFLTTIIYGITYPSIGAMYTVVTSGIYFAVFVMNIFLLVYAYIISNSKSSLWWFLAAAALYYIALFFSTERLYPLIPLLVLVEFFVTVKRKFAKPEIKRLLIRLFIILSPLILGLIYRPYAQTNVQFLHNTGLLVDGVIKGNWHFLLIPFSVLGSLFIPKDYWKYFGAVDVSNFSSYQSFYLFSPFLIYTVLTVILALTLSKRRLLFIILTLVPTYLMGMASFFLATHFSSIPQELRRHYDPGIYLHSALFGQFLASLSLAFLADWILSKFKNSFSFIMFFSIFFPFVFIFLTWLPAEPGLIFSNVHRYLTVSSIGSSLFIAGAICMIFYRMQRIRMLKHFSYLVFLFLFPIIVVNAQVLTDYFEYELDFAGTRGSEHLRMKNKFISFLDKDFTTEKPALFFVDASGDNENGYFHETTIMAGFEFWMKFRNRIDPDPGGINFSLVRNDFFCPQGDCIQKFKDLVAEKDGQKGLLYKEVFYPSNRLYAYRIYKRDVQSTREKFLKDLGLN